MKKVLVIILSVMLISFNYIYSRKCVVFADNNDVEIQQQLQDNVENQLNSLDTSSIDDAFGDIINGKLFNSTSFSEKVELIISGQPAIEGSSLLEFVGKVLLEDILAFLPAICTIIAIAILYSMLCSFASKKGICDIVHFVCYGAIVVILVAGVTNIIGLTSSTLSAVKGQMDAIFPILLTTLTALGGVNSVGIYQPAMGILSGMVISIFTKILLPIFIFKIIFNIISNLSSGIKFNKFADFFGSTFKWIIGIVVTIFTAFLSVQGLMAGSIDGISIKAAKYTIKGSVPIIGGFLSDGMGLIMMSSSLIKNAVGVSGLLLMLCTIILPVIKIIVFTFMVKITSAILEPIADARMSNFVNTISKSISMTLALVLGVAFMYLIVVGLIMCSANNF